jgi:hypothetical protein
MTSRSWKAALFGVSLMAATVGYGPAALGQSEAPLDPMRANLWTGTWTFIEGSYIGGEEFSGPGYNGTLGRVVSGDVTADDPRMAGTMTQVENGNWSPSQDPGEGEVGFANGTMRIDNDEGAWVGTWTSYFGAPPVGEEWYVLEGEGAYEGLTTVFRFHDEDGTFEGVILAAELPARPEPVAPPAE